MYQSPKGTIFDLPESEARKEAGMNAAAVARHELLADARRVAVLVAKRFGEVDADMLGDEYLRLTGIDLAAKDNLGPGMGSVFKTDAFEWTGQRRKSGRKKNHARELRVWRLKA